MKFSLIIPTLNEFKNLKIILPKIKNLSKDIIIIDGNSNDGTEQLCNEHNIKFVIQKSKGKGNALKEAIEFAKYDTLCFFDADLSHNPYKIIDLVTPVFKKHFKHVSGSRMLGGSSELFSDVDHLFRLFGSVLINIAISLKFNFKMTDCQNGFRAINKKFFKSLNIKSDHTTIEQELVSKTLSLGHPILEIPTHEYSRLFGLSKISVLKHSVSYLFSLIKIVLMKKKKINMIKYKKLKNKYNYNWWRGGG